MKLGKRISALCLSLILLLGAAGSLGNSDAYAASEKNWTLFIYLCGSDLESDGGCGTGDLQEILKSTYSDKIDVVIQTGGSAYWESKLVDADKIQRFVRTKNGLECVQTLKSADMGEAATLTSFLEWGVKSYPADRMGVVFWNHGGGSITGVCFDELNDYNSLELKDIEASLKKVSSAMKGKFEFIGFDACLMATLETANILSPFSNYMYASEETEPGAGWNYTAILNYLSKNPSSDGKALGKELCESYYNTCIEDEGDESVTFSVTDLSKINNLVAAFDKVSKELYESKDYTAVVRGIIKADNFGGNNKAEGYTNMVDLAAILTNVSDYSPSAKQALSALKTAVVYNKNGTIHKNAGGLSVYYPLSIQGSTELSTFREICPSTYYLAIVNQAASGADLSASSGEGMTLAGVEDSETLSISDAYLDEDGIYTVEMNDMDEFAYASCTLFMEDDDGALIYLGESDEVIVDYDEYIIQDDFDGYWLCMEGYILPLEIVSANDYVSVYVCSILLNGEETNLQIIYDWDEMEYRILGVWEGIDPESGMAARNAEPLQRGDIINIVYNYTYDEEEWEYFVSDDIIVGRTDPDLSYELLDEADYYYCINVYDIYGNGYALDFTVFYVDEYGDTWFYED